MTIYSFDLHIHSKYSKDSLMSPKKIIKISKKLNLNGIAITDHNTIRGGIEAKKITDDDLIVIVGSEIMTNKGEIIGLFLNENIKSNDFYEAIDEIRNQGGKCILPHPFRNKRANPLTLLSEVDAIEGINSRNPEYLNLKAQNLANNHHLPLTAGSDAHISFEIGGAKTCIKEEHFSDIYSLISKNTIISGNVQFKYTRLLITCIGKSISCFRRFD